MPTGVEQLRPPRPNLLARGQATPSGGARVVRREGGGRRGDEAAAAGVAAAKEEYNLPFILSNSLMEYHLHVKKPGDDDE